MKPSEYLYNEDFMVLNDTYKLKIIDKLDKQFIDREELKDKINNEFELHRTIFKCKTIFTEKGFNNLKKKILELLK